MNEIQNETETCVVCRREPATTQTRLATLGLQPVCEGCEARIHGKAEE